MNTPSVNDELAIMSGNTPSVNDELAIIENGFERV